MHVAFLAGWPLVIAVPIVLHLVMRQQPKHLIFPAVAIHPACAQHANRRQLKLRHWLLLALRCAVIGLLALALARPSILASGVLGDQEAPVAAALVFDTNRPRMQYRQQNQTRLQVAPETARWLLPQLPPESDVAVIPSEELSSEFSVDLGAAEQRVSKLKTAATSTPLASVVERAIGLLAKKTAAQGNLHFHGPRRRAWPADPSGHLKNLLEAAGDIGLYVVDIGIAEPHDFALGDVKVSPEVVAKTGKVQIETEAAAGSG